MSNQLNLPSSSPPVLLDLEDIGSVGKFVLGPLPYVIVFVPVLYLSVTVQGWFWDYYQGMEDFLGRWVGFAVMEFGWPGTASLVSYGIVALALKRYFVQFTGVVGHFQRTTAMYLVDILSILMIITGWARDEFGILLQICYLLAACSTAAILADAIMGFRWKRAA